MNVVLLHDDIGADARADELDVFAQAEAVEAALHELGHTSARMPFRLDLGAVSGELLSLQPDRVFNLVEAVAGKGRLIHLAPALLDFLGIPYTGAPTEGMFLTSNKVLAKRLLRSSGLPTPDWVAIEAGSPRCSGRIEGRAVVKSVWEEASVGLDDHSVVDGGEIRSLAREMAVRAEGLGGEAFAEAYVEGREFNLSVLGGPSGAEVLPIAEIRFVDYAPGRPRLVGYRAKWDADSFEYHHTPRCFDFPPADAPLLGRLEELALACWRLFALRGYARVDFRVDAEGCPWILEVNANPCLSPDAGFLAAADRAGLGRTDVVGRILADTAGSVEEKREARDDVPHPSRL